MFNVKDLQVGKGNRIYGYSRVSTVSQSNDKQVDVLKQYTEHIFVDIATGKDIDRPELHSMLMQLRQGDIVVVVDIDRIGRSMKDLVYLYNEFKENGIRFIALNQSIDSESEQGEFLFNIFSSMAQLERSMISRRTKESLQYLKSQGIKLGAPVKIDEEMINTIKTLSEQGIPKSRIAKQLNISRQSVYRVLN